MSGLPPLLAPWRPVLDALHPTVAQAVGPYLPRLAAALGSLPAPQLTGLGDPDGVDGLARRGSWDQLLGSAWALADEAPDEFLRRAAQGELPFLRQARRRPQGGWRGVLWLDAGPEVVGAPRLVLIAGALVLADRIRHAGGHPIAAWREEQDLLHTPLDDVGDLVPWLSCRTVVRPLNADLQRLHQALDLDPDLDRVWGLGGPTLAELLADTEHDALEVEEALDDDAFDVHVHTAEPTRLRLPTAAPQATVQLLRDPLAPPPARTTEALDDLALRWSTMGSRLFLARGSRLTWLQARPLTRGELSWQTRELPGQIVAVAWRTGKPVVLLRRGPVLEVHFLAGAHGAWRGAPPSLPCPPELQLDHVTDMWILSDPRHAQAELGRPAPRGGETVPRAAAMLRDSAGTLWLLDALNGQATPVGYNLSEPALLFPSNRRKQLPPRFIFHQERASSERLVEWVRRHPGARLDRKTLRPLLGPDLAAGPVPTVHDHAWRDLGESPPGVELLPIQPRRSHLPLLAHRPDAAWLVRGQVTRRNRIERLHVRDRPVATDLEGPPVAVRQPDWKVISLSADRRSLLATSTFTSQVDLTLPAPLLTHAVRPRHGHVAGLDTRGHLILIDPQQGEILADLPLPDRLR